MELYQTSRMVYEGDDFSEGFNGIINFHNCLLVGTLIKLNLIEFLYSYLFIDLVESDLLFFIKVLNTNKCTQGLVPLLTKTFFFDF